MALPKCFESPEEYFEECHKFFREYQDLYKFANTEIMVREVLNQINVQSLENLDVYDENFDLELLNDEFISRFFGKLKHLKVCHNDFVEDKNLEDLSDMHLSPKKKHEIVYLAREIKESCENNTVVDFGSGLGYLDQQIFATTNFKILGLECNESHYTGAKKRQRKYHENSLQNVKFIRHIITEDSSTNIKVYLNDKFANYEGFIITGLHACADLTIDAINIFLKMEDAKSLILVPCCYHKMTLKDDQFKNFPLSGCMLNFFNRNKGFEYMKVPFLRLGAQPPNFGEKLEDSVFNLLARAVLEKYAQQKNCKPKRNNRKAVKTKVMNNSFEKYISDASSRGFTLIKNDPSLDNEKVEIDLEELRILWREIDEITAKKAGIFILLQNYMQPVVENLILFDRLMYLKENGISNCRCKKIFNELLSPRCLALIAHK